MNWRQLKQLSLCVVISAPLVLGSLVLLSEFMGEQIHPFWNWLSSLVVWSFSVGIGLQLPKRLPLKQTLLEGVGLGLLTACVNFLLLCGAVWIWLVFFFTT